MTLKLLPAYETEIYPNKGGYVSIEQRDNMGTGEDSLIVLTASQLPEVIRELQALYDSRESWQGGEPDEDGVRTAG